jgi:hypothetical protein
MTTSDDNPAQARVIFNDEERYVLLRSILEEDKSERREALVEMLLDLRQHLGQEGEGGRKVYLELHYLIEWLFRGSETYQLALELYEQRFNLKGGPGPAEVLRKVLDEQVGPTPRAEPERPRHTTAPPDLRFAPEPYRKWLEVASAVLLGIDARRLDGMHGCLSADDATLARILAVLEAA